MLYIFGALGYFLFTSFFVTESKATVLKEGESPSKLYRYQVINTEDSSNGSTMVKIEPNYADIEYPFMTFTLKNIERTVYLERPIAEKAEIQWLTQTRQEITAQLNTVSDSISVHLTEAQLEKLGYSYDSKLTLSELSTEQKKAVGKNASFTGSIYLDELTAEQLAYFGIGKSAEGRYYVLEPSAALLEELEKENGAVVYFNELSSSWQEKFSVVKDDSVLLNTLTDENLEMLGVPESGDVMLFNGKICFRYYVAILETYFDVDDRSLSISLLS